MDSVTRIDTEEPMISFAGNQRKKTVGVRIACFFGCTGIDLARSQPGNNMLCTDYKAAAELQSCSSSGTITDAAIVISVSYGLDHNAGSGNLDQSSTNQSMSQTRARMRFMQQLYVINLRTGS